MTTVTCDDESRKFCNVTVGRCNQLKTFEKSSCEKKPRRALIVPGSSISKKEPINKSAKKPNHLCIIPGEPILLYQQGNNNSCILSSLA